MKGIKGGGRKTQGRPHGCGQRRRPLADRLERSVRHDLDQPQALPHRPRSSAHVANGRKLLRAPLQLQLAHDALLRGRRADLHHAPHRCGREQQHGGAAEREAGAAVRLQSRFPASI
jgi:hypothetical protein